MTNFIISEFNVQTQELTTREMTDEEQAQYLIDCERVAQIEAAEKERQEEADAQAAAKAAAKAELLATLNLSQETLDLLNGLN